MPKRKKIIKKKVKKQEDGAIICMYCKEFWKLSVIRDENDNRTPYRFCNKKKERISIDSEICEKYYKPSQFIYCANCSCWLDTIACLNRYKREMPECVGCVQFNFSIIQLLERYFDDFSYGDPERNWLKQENILPITMKPKRKLKQRKLKRRNK